MSISEKSTLNALLLCYLIWFMYDFLITVGSSKQAKSSRPSLVEFTCLWLYNRTIEQHKTEKHYLLIFNHSVPDILNINKAILLIKWRT